MTNVTVLGSGALTLGTASGGLFGTVSFTAPGAVTVTNPGALTVQNLSTPSSDTSAVSITANGGVLTLGSGIVLGGTGLVTFKSNYLAGGAVPSIVDSAPGIRIFGETSFVSDGNISITNSGHSLGPVSLTSTGSYLTGTSAASGTAGFTDVTYTEGGTANLRNVSVGTSNYPGTLTVVSTGGSIVQAAAAPANPVGFTAAGSIVVPSASGAGNTVSFTSALGSVILSNAGNLVQPPVTLSAVGNSSITQSTGATLVFGNVAVASGTFTVDTSATAGAAVSQIAGTTMRIFGNPTINTQGAKVTLTNTGNNFGGITVNTTNGAAAGADIAITESGVMNLLSINTGSTGKFTATSENASIIQSGTGGITVGAAGVTSLTAVSGVALNTATTSNNFGGGAITINTAGNVTLQDANAVTTLGGGTTIGGTMTLKNSAAGLIKDSPGTIAVNGNVLFDDAGGTVSIGSSSATFGAIQFRAKDVTIVENATLNLAAGSVASGNTSLTSSGNIVTSGAGGGTFQGTLALNASGSITVGIPIFVANGLTFRSLGAVDLSALSLAGNLNNIAPINLGASSYKAPSP